MRFIGWGVVLAVLAVLGAFIYLETSDKRIKCEVTQYKWSHEENNKAIYVKYKTFDYPSYSRLCKTFPLKPGEIAAHEDHYIRRVLEEYKSSITEFELREK